MNLNELKLNINFPPPHLFHALSPMQGIGAKQKEEGKTKGKESSLKDSWVASQAMPLFLVVGSTSFRVVDLPNQYPQLCKQLSHKNVSTCDHSP